MSAQAAARAHRLAAACLISGRQISRQDIAPASGKTHNPLARPTNQPTAGRSLSGGMLPLTPSQSPFLATRAQSAGLRVRSRRAVAATLVAAVLLAGGCTVNPLAGVSPDSANGGSGAASLVPVLVAAFDQPAVAITPRWTVEYDRPVTATLSADGSLVLVGRSYGSVRSSTQWGVVAHAAADGKQLWSRTFTQARYRTIAVAALGPQPWLTAGVFTYGSAGQLRVLDAAGNLGWTRDVNTSVTVRSDAAGTVIFGLDHGAGRLFLIEAATGTQLASMVVGKDAYLQVASDGTALVITPQSLLLVSSAGQLLATVPVDREFTSVLLSPDGEAVYAVSAGADSTLYRFDLAGKLLWQYKLPFGGTNTLEASADGRFVAVANAGLDHGLLLFQAATGQLWREFEFAPATGAKGQFARSIHFLAGDAGMLVDYAVARDRAGVHVEERSLLLLDYDHGYVGRVDLGANADVVLSADGLTCLTVSTVPLDGSIADGNHIELLDIGPLLGAR